MIINEEHMVTIGKLSPVLPGPRFNLRPLRGGYHWPTPKAKGEEGKTDNE
jgi:hypothetical protein